jgi:hypothetical protein
LLVIMAMQIYDVGESHLRENFMLKCEWLVKYRPWMGGNNGYKRDVTNIPNVLKFIWWTSIAQWWITI